MNKKLLISIIVGAVFGIILNLIFTLIVGYFVSGQCLTGSQFCDVPIIGIASFLLKISWMAFIVLGIVIVYKVMNKTKW